MKHRGTDQRGWRGASRRVEREWRHASRQVEREWRQASRHVDRERQRATRHIEREWRQATRKVKHRGARGRKWRQEVSALDRRLTRRWTRRLPPQADQSLIRLSRAADHSVLWLVMAAAIAVVGGKRGRRVAEHGLAAVAATSAMVNGPIKLMVDRRRPAPGRRIIRTPRTSSFPSGHAASGFAFATATTRELPEAGPLLVPLAATVAYSRVYLGVHYPSDVLAGAAFGTAVGLGARPALREIRTRINEIGHAPQSPSRAEAVLVTSPHSGNSSKLSRSRRVLTERGIHVVEELDIEHLDRLPHLLRTAAGEPRLVIAAGGDGTVGSVAGCLAGQDNLLGVLPLGTGNDFARSLYIPMSPSRAAAVIATGEVSSVDLGHCAPGDGEPAYFAHAATAGINVDFARLATRGSVRARLGHLTYLAAAVYAIGERTPFTCALQVNGDAQDLSLVQLTVMNASVVGGSLGLSLRSPYANDHRLDVLAVEDVPGWKLFLAGAFLLFRINRSVSGIRTLHPDRLVVNTSNHLGMTLDGELAGTLPAEFEEVAGAVKVITPRRS